MLVLLFLLYFFYLEACAMHHSLISDVTDVASRRRTQNNRLRAKLSNSQCNAQISERWKIRVNENNNDVSIKFTASALIKCSYYISYL